jgi:hypothetical protein
VWVTRRRLPGMRYSSEIAAPQGSSASRLPLRPHQARRRSGRDKERTESEESRFPGSRGSAARLADAGCRRQVARRWSSVPLRHSTIRPRLGSQEKPGAARNPVVLGVRCHAPNLLLHIIEYEPKRCARSTLGPKRRPPGSALPGSRLSYHALAGVSAGTGGLRRSGVLHRPRHPGRRDGHPPGRSSNATRNAAVLGPPAPRGRRTHPGRRAARPRPPRRWRRRGSPSTPTPFRTAA